MLLINLEARLKNKSFWVSIFSAIVLLSQQFGFDISTYIPKNYVDIINTVFFILTTLGIAVDTSTPGISDKVIRKSTVQAINQAIESKEEVKTEASTTAINNDISENSQSTPTDNLNASSKIMVDVPVEE